jgi:hypothetical protein
MKKKILVYYLMIIGLHEDVKKKKKNPWLTQLLRINVVIFIQGNHLRRWNVNVVADLRDFPFSINL